MAVTIWTGSDYLTTIRVPDGTKIQSPPNQPGEIHVENTEGILIGIFHNAVGATVDTETEA